MGAQSGQPANPWAGEVVLVMDGKAHVCKLTLGALAEMEAALPEGGLIDLIERLEAGTWRAADLIALLAAGLRGGGWSGDGTLVGAARIDGGLPGALRVARALIERAFVLPGAEGGA
jgi:hypothetical protein